jgi:hypothetical protein
MCIYIKYTCTRCFRAHYVITKILPGCTMVDSHALPGVSAWQCKSRTFKFSDGGMKGWWVHIERKHPLLTLSTNEILARGLLYFYPRIIPLLRICPSIIFVFRSSRRRVWYFPFVVGRRQFVGYFYYLFYRNISCAPTQTTNWVWFNFK